MWFHYKPVIHTFLAIQHCLGKPRSSSTRVYLKNLSLPPYVRFNITQNAPSRWIWSARAKLENETFDWDVKLYHTICKAFEISLCGCFKAWIKIFAVACANYGITSIINNENIHSWVDDENLWMSNMIFCSWAWSRWNN